jgi:hypothetical protein
MAGSYCHLRDEHGEFTFEHIGNMGDAHEACHECFFMINFLAGGDKKRIKEAVDAYYKAANHTYNPDPDEKLCEEPEDRVCPTCDGEGYLHGFVEEETCGDCEGTGER